MGGSYRGDPRSSIGPEVRLYARRGNVPGAARLLCVPRFHFSVYDGVSLPDARVVDLPDTGAAQIEAVRLAAELLQDGATRRRLGQGWRMEVTDASGVLLFRLDFTVTDAGRAERSAP